TGSGQPSKAASRAHASQRAHSRGPYSGNGENSPQPAGPCSRTPSLTVCPRNLVRIGIRNTTGERVTTLPAAAAVLTPSNLARKPRGSTGRGIASLIRVLCSGGAGAGPSYPGSSPRGSEGVTNLTSMGRNPSHPDRPLHALVRPAGPELYAAIRDALSGEGPAVLPLTPGQAGAAIAALRPTHVDGEPVEGGLGVPPDVAVVIATSGTTGAPKGVMLSATALRTSAASSLRRIGAARGERWLCCLPASHVSGLQVLVRSLLSESEPIMHERFDARAVLGSGADHVSLVPTQLHRLVELGADLSGFRTILLGGAAPRPGLLDEARELGATIVTTYGMTETCGGCVYDGRPLYNVDLKIGEDGRIRVAGPVLFSGYRSGEPAPFDGGWFITSDLGELSDGR